MNSDKKIYITIAALILIVVLSFFGYFYNSGSISLKKSVNGSFSYEYGKVLKIDDGWSAFTDKEFQIEAKLQNGSPVEADVFRTGNYFFKVELNTIGMKGQNAFLINPLFSASALWVNGELLHRSGIPGAAAESEKPFFSSVVVPYTQVSDEIEIVLQVSNYSNLYGGSFLNWLSYGRFNDVVRFSRQGRLTDFIIIFSLLSLALIHFFNYIYHREFNYSLFLFLYLFIYALYAMLNGRFVITTFIPLLSGALILRLQNIIIILTLPVMLNYMKALFPDEVHKKIIAGVQILSLAFAVLSAAVPLAYFRYIEFSYFSFKTAGGLYLFICLIRALKAGRKGSLMTLITFSVLLLTILNDYFYSIALISTARLMFAGVIIFAVFQTVRLISDSIEFYRESIRAHRSLAAVISQKETFFSRNSLELDAPIRNILELAESLLRGAIGPLNSEQIATSSLIYSNGVRISNMLNDILDFQHIRDNDIELKTGSVNLYRISQKVLASCESLVAVQSIDLEMKIDRECRLVEADERRMEQVLYNLVSSSIRHTENGSIIIEAEEGPDKIEIRISVTGSDLDNDAVNRIFSAYETNSGGNLDDQDVSDLSFAIAGKLLELHGSAIEVDAQEDRICYRFKLDYWQGDKPLTEEEVLEMDALINLQPVFDEITADRNIEVLISGKDIEELQVLKSQLASMNYSVVPLISGKDLLDRIQINVPDLVVMDVKLSDMSGYEVCSEIRKAYPKDELPVILVINKEDVTDLMRGLTSGANDFLTRPYIQEEFLTRVNTHLQLARISHVYSRFVPTEFLKSLGQENIVDVQLGDQVSKEMTILFVDIRAFTNLSENMTPEENFKFINSYLSRFSPMITNNGGFVDKYIGDAIMALFPYKPENALAAAREMIEHVNVYNGHRANCGYRPIDIGIGIHTGNMILGIIGDEERMQGTVISDAVNLASRIQDVTKLYKANVVISQETFVKLENPMAYNFRFLGRVRVKGKDKAVALFEIFDSDSDEKREKKNNTKVNFEDAMFKFSHRNFKEAQALFEKVALIDPEDNTTQVFLERIKEMRMEEKKDFLTSL